MPITVGQRMPNTTFTLMKADGIHQIKLAALLAGRKIVLFGLPGAFTPTCSSAHLPSFIRVLPALKEKGVDDVVCVSVNDPHVMAAWSRAEGAQDIVMLSDASCTFTDAIGMRFDAPHVGMVARSVRYSMLVDDMVVTQLHMEIEQGACNLTTGEAMLSAL